MERHPNENLLGPISILHKYDYNPVEPLTAAFLYRISILHKYDYNAITI